MFSRVISRLERDYVNRVMRRFVGIGPRIQIENVGRKTGVVRRTPVLGFRDGDVFRVAVNHEDAQWCKNVVAAGSCKVVLRDHVLDVRAPRLRPAEDCLDLLPNPYRWLFRHIVHTVVILELPTERRTSLPTG
jgi:deazaflavin-dependent oxidoreductase (nitroreductase family)